MAYIEKEADVPTVPVTENECVLEDKKPKLQPIQYGADFSVNLNAYLSVKNNSGRNRPVPVCGTPNALIALNNIGISVPSFPITIKPNDIDKCLESQTANKNKNSHNLTFEELASLPNLLENPVMIFNTDKSGYIAVVTDKFDNKGNPFVVAVELNQKSGFGAFHRVASMHGREHMFEPFIARNGNTVEGYITRNINDGNLLALNTEKAHEFFLSTGLQLPETEEQVVCFDNSIKQNLSSVNTFSINSLRNILEPEILEDNMPEPKNNHPDNTQFDPTFYDNIPNNAPPPGFANVTEQEPPPEYNYSMIYDEIPLPDPPPDYYNNPAEPPDYTPYQLPSKVTEYVNTAPHVAENPDVKAYKDLCEKNSVPTTELSAVISELSAMREQLSKSQTLVADMQKQLTDLKDKPAFNPIVSAVTLAGKIITAPIVAPAILMAKAEAYIADGCKNAVENFGKVGVKALNFTANLLHIKPIITAIGKQANAEIKAADGIVKRIETFSQNAHTVSAGLKNMGLALRGKETIYPKEVGKIAHTLEKPFKAHSEINTKIRNSARTIYQALDGLEKAAKTTKKEIAKPSKDKKTKSDSVLSTKNISQIGDKKQGDKTADTKDKETAKKTDKPKTKGEIGED
jgi:hypothetical protein